MSEMIERVAAALTQEFEPYRVFDEGEAERLARAAIAAMREPTVGVARAANDAFPDAPGETTCSALGSDLWRAMIDAALKP